MTQATEELSAQQSPNTLEKNGVRRVNNLPLFIALAIFAFFVVTIALVAVKRAHSSSHVLKTALTDNHQSTATMVAAIVGNHTSGIIAAGTKVTPTTANNQTIPVMKVNNPDVPPLPPRLAEQNPQLQQIRQAKFQAFEQAVQAKTHIALPHTQNASSSLNAAALLRVQLLHQMAETRAQLASSEASDLNTPYQQKLLAMEQNLAGGNQRITPPASVSSAMQPFSGILGQEGDRWRLNHSIQAPETLYEIRTGTVIPGVMISGINSELPGLIQGQVAENVYDTASGKYLLIPQGTRLIGTYSSNVVYGQSAVLIAWQRLIFPDGKALDIGAMPGADSAGFTGFRDQVNNHYWRIFGSAFLMSAVTAGIAYSQDQNRNNGIFMQPTMSSEMSQALGQQLGEVTAQMIAKNLNIAPTLEIRPGYRFNIMVTKDLVFAKAYQSFDYAN